MSVVASFADDKYSAGCGIADSQELAARRKSNSVQGVRVKMETTDDPERRGIRGVDEDAVASDAARREYR